MLSRKPKTTLIKCKGCREKKEPYKRFAVVCGISCAETWALELKAKEERKQAKQVRQEDKIRKEALKTRGDYLREAQAVFNAWIRWRDAEDPCISCQMYHQGAYDAGHFRGRGAAPALRFHEDNVHKQCVPCNQHKSGNVIEYRINLIRKIGTARVNFLESEQAPEKWTIDEIKAIKAKYAAKLKKLNK